MSVRNRVGTAKWRMKHFFTSKVEARFRTAADPQTGLLFQRVAGQKVFLRYRHEYMPDRLTTWLCRDIYFKHYWPEPEDVVVDIGAGLGHEAIHLWAQSPDVRYFGVEVQPSIYECLANTFAPIRENFVAVGSAIGDDARLFIGSSDDYTRASTISAGYIEVPVRSWLETKRHFGLDTVDLMKINIEGGERALLEQLGDMEDIRRVIVSAHDFRADRGDGEQFRTRSAVRARLLELGYTVAVVGEGAWLQNWLFAQRG